MRRLSDRTRTRRAALALALGGVLLGSAHARGESPDGPQAAMEDADDFVIHQSLRVGSSARADFERATSLLAAERYAEAIPLLLRVTEAVPKSTAAHVDLGMAYERTGDHARAEASFVSALETSPHHPVALNELGMIQRKTGRFAEARRSYEQALARHPTFRFAQRNLAILCDLYLADRECALEHYQRYARLAPNDAAIAKWIADLRARPTQE